MISLIFNMDSVFRSCIDSTRCSLSGLRANRIAEAVFVLLPSGAQASSTEGHDLASLAYQVT